MAQNPNLAALSAAGVSVWLDDLSRDRLQTGNLPELIDTKCVVGVTTNPSIFQAALSKGTAYDEQVNELAERSADVGRHHPHRHHRRRAQRLRRAGRAVRGCPAASTAGCRSRSTRGWRTTPTRRSCRPIELWKIVDRPNLLIKIPATLAGLPAITAVIAEGISVNVTLIFSVERHRAGDGRLPGRAGSRQGGRARPVQDPLGRIVLRLPGGHRDRQAAGEDRHRRGAWRCAGRPVWPTPGWRTRPTRRCSSAVRATRRSRPTAPACSGRCGRRPGSRTRTTPTPLYVTELVAPNTVNTMPEKTIDAVADHGVITGDTVTGTARRCAGGVRQARRGRHRPAGRVQGARGRGRGEVREVVARAARGDQGSARRRQEMSTAISRQDGSAAPAGVIPLRDKRDKRMPRIPGPCGVVIFGVTGDLARRS